MTFSPRAWRVIRGAGAAVLMAAVLAACGGATSQVEKFHPTRLVVFGDEFSALIDSDTNGNGHHYAMNALDSADTSNSTLLCSDSGRQIWVQRVAAYYGMVFKECNPSGLSDDQLKAKMQARFGADLAAMQAQVEAFNANIIHDQLGSNDLVTLMIGVHDMVAIYRDNLNFSSDQAKKEEARARGRRYAALVNSVARMGARVLVSQLFDVGLTPWAQSLGALDAALISTLSSEFNKGLLEDLINDGTGIGEMAVNDVVANLVTYGRYDLTNLACDEDRREPIDEIDSDGDGYIDGGDRLQSCTTATLTMDGASTKSLWADGLRLNAYLAHPQIGAKAVSLLRSLPF